MKVAIGNDHAGVQMKKDITEYLITKGFEVINYGTDSLESYDYPVAAKDVCEAVKGKEADFGICICGTGIGISIAANKIRGIRAANCTSEEYASLAKQHNHANVICFGARFIQSHEAIKMIEAYLAAEQMGDRHQRRVDEITALEENF